MEEVYTALQLRSRGNLEEPVWRLGRLQRPTLLSWSHGAQPPGSGLVILTHQRLGVCTASEYLQSGCLEHVTSPL